MLKSTKSISLMIFYAFFYFIYDVWFYRQENIFSTDLVKDECLADGAPLGGQ